MAMDTRTSWAHLPSSAALSGVLDSGPWARYWPPPTSRRAMQQPPCARLPSNASRLGAQPPRLTVASQRAPALLLFLLPHCLPALPSPPRSIAKKPKTIATHAGAPPPPPPAPATAMDRFPDGMHVWLWSPVRRAYLSADDDGRCVSLSTCHSTLNSAWQVHRVSQDGSTYLSLQSSAYGRYLALSPYPAPHGHPGRNAIVCDFDEHRQRDIRWRAVPAGGASRNVLLCTVEDRGRYLRASTHGEPSSCSCSCVSVERRRSTLANWTILTIPPRPAPPSLPAPSTALGGDMHWRRIRCKRATDQGNFLRTRASEFKFYGCSVFNLQREVAMKLGVDMSTITLCMHPGFYGRLIPLVVNLPGNNEPLDIVVLPTNSEAAQALVHPDVTSTPQPKAGLEMLKDGAFVRLKCWAQNQHCCLNALDDGLGVNLSPEGTSHCLQDVWVVQEMMIDERNLLLFRSAAFGRYFALMEETNVKGSRFAQIKFDDQEQSDLLWVVTSLRGSDQVYLNRWNSDSRLTLLWTVEAVAITSTPPILPGFPAPAAARHHASDPGQKKNLPERLVWYRRDNDLNQRNPWMMLQFKGQSLSSLWSKLTTDSSEILCMRAGRFGHLTPLTIDLPDNKEPMDVIILEARSKVAQELRYPVVNPRGV